MKNSILILLFAAIFTSCSEERIGASGTQVSETRKREAFNSVSTSGSNRIHITYGSVYEVKLRGSDNLISHFKTKVVDDELHLGYEDFNVSDDDIEVFVTLPVLRGVEMSGSGQVTINGAFPTQGSLEFQSSGSGALEVQDAFQADAVDVTVSGSGKTDVQRIHSKTAEVQISGSGEVMVAPKEALKVSVSGSGKAYYTGNPRIDSSISGSGEVIRL
jgi:hypothetical protein